MECRLTPPPPSPFLHGPHRSVAGKPAPSRPLSSCSCGTALFRSYATLAAAAATAIILRFRDLSPCDRGMVGGRWGSFISIEGPRTATEAGATSVNYWVPLLSCSRAGRCCAQAVAPLGTHPLPNFWNDFVGLLCALAIFKARIFMLSSIRCSEKYATYI